MKILIGGSPCTYWSIAQTKDRETKAEGLGWELFKNFWIAREKYKPDYFLYENNKSISAAIRAQITEVLGVGPNNINSALVSAQSRWRTYWVGKRNPDGTYSQVPVEQPEDLGIVLRDILESGVCWREKAYTLRASAGEKQGRGNIIRGIITNGKFSYTGVAEPVGAFCINQAGGGKARTVDAHMAKLENNLVPRINNPNPAKQQYDCIVEPVRIGTIESEAKNLDFDSQQYRVYSPDGKSVTLCGKGGGVGAKTGLYATPIRVGDKPNAAGEISGSQSGRIYSVDGKGVPLQARPNGGGADGAATGLYAVPACVVEEDKGDPAIKTADGKIYPIYEVRGGQITIKGKQYPIKLADGFYIIRKLTVTECKRLQTVPESYVFPVSDTQAYKMLGNGWTVDVIAHIMRHFEGLTAEPVEVLSMYDGMSCGHLALDKLGVEISAYYATEIDKYAIKTTQHNFPDTIQMGDAFQVRADDWVLPTAREEAAENGGNCAAG